MDFSLNAYCPYGYKKEVLEILAMEYSRYFKITEKSLKFSESNTRHKRLTCLGLVTSIQHIIKNEKIEEYQTLNVVVTMHNQNGKETIEKKIEYVNCNDMKKNPFHGICFSGTYVKPIVNVTKTKKYEIIKSHNTGFTREYLIYENVEDKRELDNAKYLVIDEMIINDIDLYNFSPSLYGIRIENLIAEEDTSDVEFISMFTTLINEIINHKNLRNLYISFDSPWDELIEKYNLFNVLKYLHQQGVEIFME